MKFLLFKRAVVLFALLFPVAVVAQVSVSFPNPNVPYICAGDPSTNPNSVSCDNIPIMDPNHSGIQLGSMKFTDQWLDESGHGSTGGHIVWEGAMDDIPTGTIAQYTGCMPNSWITLSGTSVRACSVGYAYFYVESSQEDVNLITIHFSYYHDAAGWHRQVSPSALTFNSNAADGCKFQSEDIPDGYESCSLWSPKVSGGHLYASRNCTRDGGGESPQKFTVLVW